MKKIIPIIIVLFLLVLAFCYLPIRKPDINVSEKTGVEESLRIDSTNNVTERSNDNQYKTPPPHNLSREWKWNSDGAFKYPRTFHHEEIFVEDVPAIVEVYSKGNIQLCYWPMLGMWSTCGDFPEEGVWLSPTERVKNVTYHVDSKGIASGYTQNGNIYYLKQKIMYGGEVNHSMVLVLINPPSLKDKVTTLTNEVANW